IRMRAGHDQRAREIRSRSNLRDSDAVGYLPVGGIEGGEHGTARAAIGQPNAQLVRPRRAVSKKDNAWKLVEWIDREAKASFDDPAIQLPECLIGGRRRRRRRWVVCDSEYILMVCRYRGHNDLPTGHHRQRLDGRIKKRSHGDWRCDAVSQIVEISKLV